MRTAHGLMVAVAAALLCGRAEGDILHLRDGSRYYGDLIQQSDSEVVFRIVLDAEGSSVVRAFAAGRVAGVQRSAQRVPPATPAAQRRAQRSYEFEQCEQVLREALELIDDGDDLAALLALQFLIDVADAATLDRLSERVRAWRGQPLAELMAAVRLRQALGADGPSPLDLGFATRYEAAALGRQLEALVESTLARRHGSLTLREWLDAPELPDEPTAATRRLVRDARLAAAAIGARLRFDHSLDEQRALRVQWARRRGDLAALIARLQALPGYTNVHAETFGQDPTLAVAERLRAAEAAAASQPADEAAAASQPTGEAAASQSGEASDVAPASEGGVAREPGASEPQARETP